MVGDGARRNMGEGGGTWWVSEIMAKRSLSVKQSLLGSLQLQGVEMTEVPGQKQRGQLGGCCNNPGEKEEAGELREFRVGQQKEGRWR